MIKCGREIVNKTYQYISKDLNDLLTTCFTGFTHNMCYV